MFGRSPLYFDGPVGAAGFSGGGPMRTATWGNPCSVLARSTAAISRLPGSSTSETVTPEGPPGLHPSMSTLMRPFARSGISANTGQLHCLSSSFPSHTSVASKGERSRGTHSVAAVNLACPRFLRSSAIQDSTTGRSLSWFAGSVGRMILTYTLLDFGAATVFGVSFCAITA